MAKYYNSLNKISINISRSLSLRWQSRLSFLFLLLRYVYLLLDIDISPIMVARWHQEITCFLALFRPYIAISGQLVVTTWEFVHRVLVYIHFFVVFSGLYVVSFKEHFDLQTEICCLRIRSNSQKVESVLFVHGVFHVVVLFTVDFKEFVVFGIISECCGLLELLSQNFLGNLVSFLPLREGLCGIV